MVSVWTKVSGAAEVGRQETAEISWEGMPESSRERENQGVDRRLKAKTVMN